MVALKSDGTPSPGPNESRSRNAVVALKCEMDAGPWLQPDGKQERRGGIEIGFVEHFQCAKNPKQERRGGIEIGGSTGCGVQGSVGSRNAVVALKLRIPGFRVSAGEGKQERRGGIETAVGRPVRPPRAPRSRNAVVALKLVTKIRGARAYRGSGNAVR